MPVAELIKELEKLVEKYGEDIDVLTFSNELGIYKCWNEVERIKLSN